MRFITVLITLGLFFGCGQTAQQDFGLVMRPGGPFSCGAVLKRTD